MDPHRQHAIWESRAKIGPVAILSLLSLSLAGCMLSGTQAATNPAVTVTLSPTSASVQAGHSQQFSATVSGSTNTGVTWAATGGSISSSGMYTAPVSAGSYLVTATSMADTTVSGSAAVTVTAAVSVSISPISASILTNGTQQFTATVSGSSNTAVTWSATGGSVSSSGLYTAPTTAGTYTVKATSAADNSKSASASVTVSAPVVAVTISPTSASILTNGTQQFTATVSGSSNTAVTWSATGGSVSSAGLYTAPGAAGTYTVTATSVADNTKSASATVTVSAPVVAVTISPTSASILTNGTQQFTATVSGSSNTAVTWSATGGSVSSSGLYTAPSTAGTFTAKATSVADNTKSASATVTVSAPVVAVTISPTSASIQTSGSRQFTATVTGASNTAVTWSATGGSVSSAGLYTAPGAAGTYTVTATSVADNTKSASATVTVSAPVVAVTISPTSASIQTSGTKQFTATVTGASNTAVTWSATGGSVSSAGLYTAPGAAGTYTVTATSVADTTKSASAAVTVTAPPSGGLTHGPLVASATNRHWFVDTTGKAVALSGSHTWNNFQDLSQASPPSPALDYTAYVSFLKAHGHNVTILWRKDLPTYCNWGAGGTWNDATWPWPRNGAGTASDGLPKFDLSQFNQAYFDRLRARTIALQQAGIYAIVQLFDGLQLLDNRCGNDGYPFTGANNINGVDDGGGTGSMTMSGTNSITNVQDAYVQKTIDSLNDLDNVIWEASEEAPSNSTWWQSHMISLLHSYEAGKPAKHPVLYPMLTGGSDSTLFGSAAEAVAPAAKPAPTNNQGKVIIEDSDHNYFGMWNDSAQVNRNYFWESFSNGASTIFMDPYEIYWTSGNRNLCGSPTNGVCSSPDPRWDNLRNNLGAIVSYGNRMNLLAMTPQPSLSSTGYALANASAAGEYLVYAPNGGSFTVNLAATSGTLSIEWFNPSSGATTSGGTVPAGATTSFVPPFSGDAVLYLKTP